MRESCWLRNGCPCQTGSCSSSQPLDDGCPVYRWFRDIFKGNKWISVKDRLPELHLVNPHDPVDPDARYFLSEEVLVTDGKGYDIQRYCNSPWAGWVDAYFKVTHWMPLPEPPEEESNDP